MSEEKQGNCVVCGELTTSSYNEEFICEWHIDGIDGE